MSEGRTSMVIAFTLVVTIAIACLCLGIYAIWETSMSDDGKFICSFLAFFTWWTILMKRWQYE